MKKTLTLIAFAGMFAFVACGPSKEEMEKKAQMMKDSIAADSTAKAAKMQASTDSANAAAAAEQAKMKASADSAAHADSVAKKLIKVKK